MMFWVQLVHPSPWGLQNIMIGYNMKSLKVVLEIESVALVIREDWFEEWDAVKASKKTMKILDNMFSMISFTHLY